MCRNSEYNLKEMRSNNIYKHALNMGDLGICIWDMNKNQMLISEKITGYELDSVKSMDEFINIIAYKKDRMLALQDLYDFLYKRLIFYRSTFRIRTKNGDIKWVLLKGRISKDTAGSSLLSVIMFNVTDNKLYEGHDSLTSLPNKNFILRKLNNLIKMNKDYNTRGALIYIDIDNFKALNDSFSSYIGDLILKLFAQSINNLLDGYSELARLSGDEFLIIVYKFNDIKEIEKTCNKVYKYLKKPFEIMGNEIYVNVSLGVTVFPDDSSDADDLLKFCDFAMYKSKHKGKNMCTFFDKQIYESYSRKILIESELKKSIINNELYICYQPQVNALNNKIIGFEALLRWNNNKLGNVPPAEFIPIAENNGYIVQIGNWVLDRVLKTVCIWKEKGFKFNTISVNISPNQLRRSDFNDNLLNACARYNISPDLLELEITEVTLVKMAKDKIESLKELMKFGVNIAIDDFGTGYSSLNYLISLPINTLKIDKSFIDNIENVKNKALIKSIVDLSKAFEYKVITEGVETKEQLHVLTGLGCNIIQGFFFSKPLPENEIENLFKSYS